jgi:hypothetical protein
MYKSAFVISGNMQYETTGIKWYIIFMLLMKSSGLYQNTLQNPMYLDSLTKILHTGKYSIHYYKIWFENISLPPKSFMKVVKYIMIYLNQI